MVGKNFLKNGTFVSRGCAGLHSSGGLAHEGLKDISMSILYKNVRFVLLMETSIMLMPIACADLILGATIEFALENLKMFL